MKKHLVIATLTCVALSVLAFAFTKGRSAPPQNRTRMRSDSVRERAKQTGGVTGTARSTNLRRYDDLVALARESEIIVTGSVESEINQLLPPKEKLVVTDSTVRVEEVLKGKMERSQTILVRGPGGRVDFDDGTFADVRMPDFWRNPQLGKSYVFFLDKRGLAYFVLHGGPQGLFEITAKGIKPQVRSTDRLMNTYDGKDIPAFLQEIRQAAN